MNTFKINKTIIGDEYPVYFIAEISCNHNQNKDKAMKLIKLAKDSGATAVKFQTYTPDTMTIKSDKSYFRDCLKGSMWEGETLYDLYSRAYTPWEWHEDLQTYARSLGLDFFTSPFDTTAVDFLESLDVPCYKIASFEVTDHVLLKRVAKTKKPVIISSGMATLDELSEAVEILKCNGTESICVLKCTSAYPAKYDDANLNTLRHMKDTFNTVVGLSDHTLGLEVPLMSVALGARIIEKHFTESRDSGSPDDAFSLTPVEFKQMVTSIRIAEKTLGNISYGKIDSESSSKKFRKSLFVVNDIKKGEVLTSHNIRPIRPAYGLHTRYYDEVLGKTATIDIEKGEPLKFDYITYPYN